MPKNWESILTDSLKSGWLTTGPIVNEFESRLSSLLGFRNTVAVNSCTGALHLALAAKGFGNGHKFIVPTYTFVASVGCGEYLGMEPILLDCVKDDFHVDLNNVEDLIKHDSSIKAIIPVHFAGSHVDMNDLFKLADKYNVFILEDAAHLIGHKTPKLAKENDNFAQAYSFYANKNITTIGEGGALTTDNDQLASKIRRLSLHGITKDGWDRYAGGQWEYDVTDLGFKYNMPDIAASFGLWQLSKIDQWQNRRKEIAEKYFAGISELDGIILPPLKICQGALHLFIIKFDLKKWKISRNEIINKLIEMGISIAVHYKPVHLFSYYKKTYGFSNGDFPEAEKLFNSSISLPFYPSLKNNEINYIINVLCLITKGNCL
jgi:perosamine synthetase